ncbi:MAG TPA: polyprenol monophosphomannose synthase, partial [Burkholderiaceae bacterium]|nr:polyprenol monophosphomannose synthase [Burkholderiaceae bacterium]
MHRLDPHQPLDPFAARGAAVPAPVDAGATAASSGPQARAHDAAVLSIVVPTFRERDNVAELVRRLDATLAGVAWEVVFVDDDSPDGTADVVRAIGRVDPRVRCVQRIGRRGLSSACVEGVLATSAELVAVMDADLQHDETILPEMMRAIREQGADVAVGSRYVSGGGTKDWPLRRRLLSRWGNRYTGLLLGLEVRDCTAGFRACRA